MRDPELRGRLVLPLLSQVVVLLAVYQDHVGSALAREAVHFSSLLILLCYYHLPSTLSPPHVRTSFRTPVTFPASCFTLVHCSSGLFLIPRSSYFLFLEDKFSPSRHARPPSHHSQIGFLCNLELETMRRKSPGVNGTGSDWLEGTHFAASSAFTLLLFRLSLSVKMHVLKTPPIQQHWYLCPESSTEGTEDTDETVTGFVSGTFTTPDSVDALKSANYKELHVVQGLGLMIVDTTALHIHIRRSILIPDWSIAALSDLCRSYPASIGTL